MKTGDIIKIKNSAGILSIRLEKELSLREVTRGIGDDKLPELKNRDLSITEVIVGRTL